MRTGVVRRRIGQGLLTAAAWVACDAANASVGSGASGTCSVVLIPNNADPSWRETVSDVAQHVRDAGSSADCRTIRIVADAAGATVVFTTRDGRQAQRVVDSPGEIASVVAALLVSTSPARVPPSLDPSASVPPRDAISPVPAPASSAHLEFGAAAGARIACPGSFVSPDVGLLASVSLSRWELGVLAQWDPVQSPAQKSTPAGFAMSTFAIGVSIGRRQPIGDVDLVAGVTAAVTVTSETASETTAGAAQSGGGATGGPSDAEPRTGVYAGLAFPRRARVRLRPMLGADAVPSRVGRTLAIDAALPPLPWWSVAATLGVEWDPL